MKIVYWTVQLQSLNFIWQAAKQYECSRAALLCAGRHPELLIRSCTSVWSLILLYDPSLRPIPLQIVFCFLPWQVGGEHIKQPAAHLLQACGKQWQIYMNVPEGLKVSSPSSGYYQGDEDRTTGKINSRKDRDELGEKGAQLNIHARLNLNIILHGLYRLLCLGLSTFVKLWETLKCCDGFSSQLFASSHVSKTVGNVGPDTQINHKERFVTHLKHQQLQHRGNC